MDPTSDPSSDTTADTDITLADTVAELTARGYTHQFIAADQTLMCTGCDESFGPDELHVDDRRRVQRASDPDESHLVVYGTCPHCHERGIAAIPNGPGCSDNEQGLVDQLTEPRP